MWKRIVVGSASLIGLWWLFKDLRRQDRIYVADFLTDTPDARSAVLVYSLWASGDIAPLLQITLPSDSVVCDVAVDSRGEVYAADEKSRILVYSPGSSGAAAPIRTLFGPQTTLFRPRALTLSRSDELIVADFGGPGPGEVGGVSVFAAGATGNAAPSARLPSQLPAGSTGAAQNTGIFKASGVAVDSAGRIYVADSLRNAVLVFPPGANGDVAPAVVITAGIASPQHIALDSNGSLFVCNRSSDQILVFPPGASSNTSPVRTITSSAVGSPVGIALDAAGDIYVSHYQNRSVASIWRNSSGHVTPLSVIQGPQTNLRAPQGLAVTGPLLFRRSWSSALLRSLK
jgi:hypothetical protein